MTINPYNSPYYNNLPFINDVVLYGKFKNIQKYLKSKPKVELVNNHMLKLDNKCIISKNGTKMRLISFLDWVHYTPKDLAAALDSKQVEVYYEQQLSDPKSDKNNWNDTNKEMELKTFYAVRADRAEPIKGLFDLPRSRL